MIKRRFSPKKIIMIICIAILAATVMSLVVMSLWNAILPNVIHVSTITFPQALGILLLSKILFGGFGRRGWRGGPPNGFLQQKLAIMSPEEREHFKQQWRNKCGKWGFQQNEEQQHPDQSKTK
jgi:hypothetical protein